MKGLEKTTQKQKASNTNLYMCVCVCVCVWKKHATNVTQLIQLTLTFAVRNTTEKKKRGTNSSLRSVFDRSSCAGSTGGTEKEKKKEM